MSTSTDLVPVDAEIYEGHLENDLDFDAAHAITLQVRNALQDTQSQADEAQLLLVKAYHGRAHVVMGYDSWEDYCLKEFSNLKLKLPSAERKTIHLGLRKQGMSFRAIAEVTGASKDTVQRDTATVADETDETPEKITGKDGKQRAAKKAPKPEPQEEEKVPEEKTQPQEDPKALAWAQLQKVSLASRPTKIRAEKIRDIANALIELYEGGE